MNCTVINSCVEQVECPMNQIFLSSTSSNPKTCSNRNNFKALGLINRCGCPFGQVLREDVILHFIN